MSQHLDQLIADVRELAELVRKEHRPSKRLESAALKAKAHAMQAERWQSAAAPVQMGLIGDTPREPIRVPYSDTGASLQAAKGVIETGSARKWRRWCLVRLEQAAHGCTCDDLVALADKHTGRSMHSSISARLNGLEGDGLAVRQGERATRSGRAAGIYRITEAGRETLRRESMK